MKRILVAVLLLVMLAGLAFGQDKKPTAAVSVELFGSFLAPMGIGAEFFLGPVGLGVELRGFVMGAGGNTFGSVEPGAAVRYYFGDLDGTMFLMGGVSYITGWLIGGGSAGAADFGLLKPKLAVGYNALFGKGNKTRFAAELGMVYLAWMNEGSLTSDWPIKFSPHLLLMFGRVF